MATTTRSQATLAGPAAAHAPRLATSNTVSWWRAGAAKKTAQTIGKKIRNASELNSMRPGRSGLLPEDGAAHVADVLELDDVGQLELDAVVGLDRRDQAHVRQRVPTVDVVRSRLLGDHEPFVLEHPAEDGEEL